jgi:hypothetical protein
MHTGEFVDFIEFMNLFNKYLTFCGMWLNLRSELEICEILCELGLLG